MADKPAAKLDFTVHWCARHLEPFRAEWPKGAGLAMLALFEAWVADERVIAMAPKRAGGQADTGALDALAAETSPLCCFLTEEDLAGVYAKAGVEPDGHD